MKELIEKIKELQDGFKFHCCQVTCEQIIGMIEDQESKPFNPLECGFVLDYDDNEEIRYTKRNKKTSTSITFDKDHERYFISNYVFSGAFYHEAKNIIIPNHRQGVELLRNLGVIDAD